MPDTRPDEDPLPKTPGYGAGVFFLLWAGIGWYAILSNAPILRTLGAAGLDPGPAVLPVMVCTVLTLGGLWLLVSGLIRAHAGNEPVSFQTLVIPFGFLISALVAAFLSDVIGFRIAGFLFAAVWLYVLDGRHSVFWRRAVFALVLAVVIIAVIELVFVQLLRVPLP